MSRSLVSSRLTFAAKARPFVPVAAEGTSETDWLPEQRGFELSVPLVRMSLDFVGGEVLSGRARAHPMHAAEHQRRAEPAGSRSWLRRAGASPASFIAVARAWRMSARSSATWFSR